MEDDTQNYKFPIFESVIESFNSILEYRYAAAFINTIIQPEIF